MSIFISIASYRDPQLVPTVIDCLRKARYPRDLTIGICWQHGADETLPFFDDSQFRILDIPWYASAGACWARSEIMRLWDGEDYFLQIDSHQRFVRDWDLKLLTYAGSVGSAKPLLTTYPTPFTPIDGHVLSPVPWRINFKEFTAEGIPTFCAGPIPDWQAMTRPLHARSIAAGFLFAAGTFVEEVPYDPDLYFFGEEISLAVRAFTWGYDFFHPSEVILWHEYNRKGFPKHWGDHVGSQGVEVEWWERDAMSRAKVSSFLRDPVTGPLGCGTFRTSSQYEDYAGINFQGRYAEAYTRQNLEPPKIV